MPRPTEIKEGLIQRLIDEIAPYNNLYRQSTMTRQPVYLSLGYLWDIGDVLQEAGIERVTPVAGAIGERSYITSDIVSFSFRIRNYFPDRRTIKRRFGKLVSYGAFREAFPLLENKRYHLSQAKERELVRLLNSGRRGAEIRPEIANIKQSLVPRKHIQRKDPHELDSFVRLFDQLFFELEDLMETGPGQRIVSFSRLLSPQILLFLNRLCLCFADDSFAPPQELPLLDDAEPRWAELIRNMQEVAMDGAATRNTARRLINPMNFVTMGNFLDILRDQGKMQDYISRFDSPQ